MEALIVFWVVMALVVGVAANSRGRSRIAWFLYGLLLWPVALVHVLVSAPSTAVLEERALADPRNRKCPFCAEIIKTEAKVCRHCGRDVPPLPARQSPWSESAGRYVVRWLAPVVFGLFMAFIVLPWILLRR